MKDRNVQHVLGALPFRQACEVHQKLKSRGEIPQDIRRLVRQAVAKTKSVTPKHAI
jgi:hypothetical protein